MRKLETENFKLLNRIFGYRWFHYKSHTTILEECQLVGVKIIPLEAHIRRQRLSYFGHIERMDNNRLPKVILYSELADGSRLQGGQEISYKTCIKSDLKAFGISQNFVEWSSLARDRDAWRETIKGTGLKRFIDEWYAEKNATAVVRRESKTLGKQAKDAPESTAESENEEPKEHEVDVKADKLFRIASAIIRRERALVAGHIVVNRGAQERKKKSVRRGAPIPVRISCARKSLNRIIDDEDGEEVRRDEMEKEDINSRLVKNTVHDDRTWLDQKYGLVSVASEEQPIVTVNKNGRVFTIPNIKRVVAI